MQAQILSNGHLAKTETALKASWPQLVASFLGRICWRHRLSLKDLPNHCKDKTGFCSCTPPPAPWSSQSAQNVLDTPPAPSLHSGRGQGWWEVSLLLPDPGTGQYKPPAWSPGRWRWQKMGQMFSPTCSLTLQQMRQKSHHLLRGRGNCHREQSRADWNGRTQNSCFSTSRPRGKRLPTPPAAKSVLTELSQLGPTCKKRGGLQPFCWSSPL